MLELRLLRYFVAVAETEHVGRAAARLHVSQSPLSRQVHQLEELLGTTLFTREGRRIRLTAAGRALVAPAHDLLARADALVRDVATRAHGEPRRIAVGFVATALNTGTLPAALRALRGRHPDVQIDLRHAGSEAQLALVRAGQLDVALVHGRPSGRDLHAARILEQPYRLAVARSGAWARRRLTPARLDGAPFVSVRVGDRARERWLEICAAAGFVPRVVVEVADYSSALALVEAEMGVALLPASQRHAAPPGVALRAVHWLKLRSELWAVHRARLSALAEELVQKLVA